MKNKVKVSTASKKVGFIFKIFKMFSPKKNIVVIVSEDIILN